jgi:uncharacterized delta-60 repeat protein
MNYNKIKIMKQFLPIFKGTVRYIAILFILATTAAMAQQPGSVDVSFNAGAGTNDEIRTSLVQPDGKILIAGSFSEYQGIPRNRIARLLEDGTIDPSFDPGLGTEGDNNFIIAMALQQDGKILIGGSFTSYGGQLRNRIARLHTDGSLDEDFNPGVGAGGTVQAFAVQQDGKILIGGSFTSYNGSFTGRITRLHPNGTLDTSFNPGIGANNSVTSINITSDGKIIACGWFTEFDFEFAGAIVRLQADGRLDTSFKAGTGASGIIRASVLQSDAKILIAGHFNSYNGTTRRRIARLLSDGSLDTDFDAGTVANSFLFAIALQPDAKILVGGGSFSSNGVALNNLLRLYPDGTLDANFNHGATSARGVNTILVQPNNRIFVAGEFASYNGEAHNNIVSLLQSVTTYTGSTASKSQIKVFPNPTSGEVTLLLNGFSNTEISVHLSSADAKTIVLASGYEEVISEQLNKAFVNAPAGLYILQVRLQKEFHTFKIVKQ